MGTVVTEVAPETFVSAPAEPPRDFFFAERVLTLVLIVAIAFWLRAQDPNYTTAYMDESIYVVYGRMFLARHFESPLDSPLQWSFGWYLWPLISAQADRIGGLFAIREVSAAMGSAAVMAIYGFSRRLFGNAVGLGTAAAFAVLGPAVYISRIATRDAGSFVFLTFGLWLFVRAWQENSHRDWLTSAICLFSAFLCKYVVAIYFPILFLLALWKGRRPLLAFCVPMLAASGFYLLHYWTDLRHLLTYGSGYGSLRAHDIWNVYLFQRIDFWIIALLALMAPLFRERRGTVSLMWVGAAAGIAFQWMTRADFDFWKHSAYILLFLAPLAVYVLLTTAGKVGQAHLSRTVLATVSVLVLCGMLAWAGKSDAYDKVAFWPNVEPVLSYFEGRLPDDARVLVDDSVFRYYFQPELSQSQIVDPFHFSYGHDHSNSAYGKAADDGWFDYVVLDGGVTPEANIMRKNLFGHLSRYTPVLQTVDPMLGHKIDIYQRSSPAASMLSSSAASITITTPNSGSVVDRIAYVSGSTIGASVGWFIRLEVFTNRWYPIGKVRVLPDGTFSAKALMGGEGNQACHHMLRARLYDDQGQPRAVSVVFNIKRSHSSCP